MRICRQISGQAIAESLGITSVLVFISESGTLDVNFFAQITKPALAKHSSADASRRQKIFCRQEADR